MRRFVAPFVLCLSLLLASCQEPVPLPAVDEETLAREVLARQEARTKRDEPSAEHPRLGCIFPTIEQGSRVDGKLLPEVVKVVGTYAENSEVWMVLRQGETDPKKWQPWPKEKVHFINCGREFGAFQELEGMYGQVPPKPRLR